MRSELDFRRALIEAEELVEWSFVLWQVHSLVHWAFPLSPALNQTWLLPRTPSLGSPQRRLLAQVPSHSLLLLRHFLKACCSIPWGSSGSVTVFCWPPNSDYFSLWHSLMALACSFFIISTRLFLFLPPIMMEKMFLLLPKVNPYCGQWFPILLVSSQSSDFICLAALGLFYISSFIASVFI